MQTFNCILNLNGGIKERRELTMGYLKTRGKQKMNPSHIVALQAGTLQSMPNMICSLLEASQMYFLLKEKCLHVLFECDSFTCCSSVDHNHSNLLWNFWNCIYGPSGCWHIVALINSPIFLTYGVLYIIVFRRILLNIKEIPERVPISFEETRDGIWWNFLDHQNIFCPGKRNQLPLDET